MDMGMYEDLLQILPEASVRCDEPMREHTTFRIGGPARFFVTPGTKEQVRDVVALCQAKEMDYAIIGNGSNLLVSDAGYDGVVIQIYRNMSAVTVTGTTVTAQAGALLTEVANRAQKAALKGLAFASGIPGTIGGACVMNAGAYGGEMKDVLTDVLVLTPAGTLTTFSNAELDLGYRRSRIGREKDIVLEATLKLTRGDAAAIREEMDDLRARRQAKQPLEYPSAGSTFQRPKGYYAGQLIQEAGLSGLRVGDAQVSEKHNGFVINRGHATAADVDALMQQIIARVKENAGVELTPEVKKLGEF